MIDSEISGLDRAERGEFHGNGSHKDKAMRPDNGEGTSMHPVSQPLSQTQAALDYAQSHNIGEK